MIAATPLVKVATDSQTIASPAPAAPVTIAKAGSYDDDITARLKTMFDQLGGIERLVKNKTVTVKLNLTGPPNNRVAGRPPQFSHWAHPAVAGAAAHLFDRAGAKRVRFVESGANTTVPLEEFIAKADWASRPCGAPPRSLNLRTPSIWARGESTCACRSVPEHICSPPGI